MRKPVVRKSRIRKYRVAILTPSSHHLRSCNWAKSQRFFDHSFRVFELIQLLIAWRLIIIVKSTPTDGLNLGIQFFLHIRMHGQIVRNDSQRVGGGIKTGQQEDEQIGGDLINRVLLFTL
jgi:hypothetical protein